MPQLAAVPLLCCAQCHLRVSDQLGELGGLYADLLTPTKSGGSAKRAVGAERPQALGSEAREAREAIARLVTTWCGVLVTGFGLPVPGPDVAKRAARVRTHLPRLLADAEHAEQLLHDVAIVHKEARRRAYPAAPQGHAIGECPVGTPTGPCGGNVRAVVGEFDEMAWARCGSCKTEAVISWWQALMPAEQHEWLGMRALRWHLTLHCGRQIAESTIKSWAAPNARGEVKVPTRRVDAAGREIPAQTGDGEEPAGRVEYRVEEARALCELARGRGRPRTLVSA